MTQSETKKISGPEGEDQGPDTSLDLLFGSKTRVKLLRLFLEHPYQEFFVRQIVRRVNTQINAVRRELENLESIGILTAREGNPQISKEKRKKFFKVNPNFILREEITNLFTKARYLLADHLIDQITSSPQIKYVALTGYFLGKPDSRVDMLIVGDMNKDQLSTIVKRFEEEYEAEIRYTVFSEKEFQQRQLVVDQFLMSILESPKIVMLDKLSNL